MGALRETGRPRGSEKGFTLPEVLVTILILGILAGIAIPSLWSVVEGRRVDSATNQMVGDLRLAHSKASSRLTSHRIEIPPTPPAIPTDPDYQIGPSGSLETRFLPDRTEIYTGSIEIAFCPDGTAEAPPIGAVCPGGTATPSPLIDPTPTTTITVGSDDGGPSTVIEVNKVTSRVVVQ